MNRKPPLGRALAAQISLGFFIAISVDLADSYVNYSLTRKVNMNTDFLINSEAVIRTSSNLNRDIIEMQNALRGFLLTGDRKFLIRYNAGLKTIPASITQEKLLIRSSALQLARLDSISSIHAIWLNYSNQLIDAKAKTLTGGPSVGKYEALFESQFRKNSAKNYNNKIAAIFRLFDQSEYDLRNKRRKALSASVDETDRSSLFFSLLLVIVSSGIAFYLVRKITRRIDSMVKLAENISLGDFTTVADNKKDE